MIITTALLAIMFFPLSLLMLANSVYVSNTPTMRKSIGVAGLGFLFLSFYWTFRALGWIELGEPLPTLLVSAFFILVVLGLYSVFGTPVVLEFLRRNSHT